MAKGISRKYVRRGRRAAARKPHKRMGRRRATRVKSIIGKSRKMRVMTMENSVYIVHMYPEGVVKNLPTFFANHVPEDEFLRRINQEVGERDWMQRPKTFTETDDAFRRLSRMEFSVPVGVEDVERFNLPAGTTRIFLSENIEH